MTVCSKGCGLTRLPAQLHREVEDREWESTSFDVTRTTQLRSNEHVTEVLRDHVDTLHSERQGLASRLQQPFTGAFVAIETGKHARFNSLLRSACLHTTGQSEASAAWEWVKSAEPRDDEWSQSLAEVPSQLAALERFNTALGSVHKAATKLYEVEVPR